MLAIGSSAVLFWFGNNLHPLWPLLWFAPLPVLLFATHSSWRAAAAVSWLSLWLGSIAMWHYFRSALLAPLWAAPVIYGIAALLFVLAVLLFRALLRRGAFWTALLAFPALWVSCEYVHNIATPDGTAGSLAYTQLNFLPFLQLASITGPWGISFLLLLFPAALAIGLYLRHTASKQAWRIVAASLGVIALVLIFGAVRLAQPTPEQRVKVGLIASDGKNVFPPPDSAATERLFREYAAVAERLAAQAAQFIVMPEKLGVVTDADIRQADAVFQALADKTGSTLVVGLIRVSARAKYNQARVYAPDAPVRTYDKQHMLPAFESMFTPGTSLTVLQKASRPSGVAICKDMDFTQPARKYGETGVGLMLVPAWDFGMDRWWHGHIAVMRGVESGFSVARSAKGGYLTVSDSRGRILAQARSDSAPFATLIADVPVAHSGTVYLVLGDWFAWVALAISCFAILQLYRLRRRRRKPQMASPVGVNADRVIQS
jgi:apolipoprotein N-acyltransferase